METNLNSQKTFSYTHKRCSSFMQARSSIYCSQQLAPLPHDQPSQSTPNMHKTFKIYPNVILPSTLMPSASSSVLNQHLFTACSMPRQSHTPLLDNFNIISWAVQIIRLLTLQFCPFLSLLGSNIWSVPVLSLSSIRVLPMWQTAFWTHTKYRRKLACMEHKYR